MQLQNAADSITPLKLSTTFGADKTAIVLSDGQSLDEHLEWVRINREKLFVIAVSEVSGKLITHGLTPDLSVSIDSQDSSYESSKAGLNWADVPLIHHSHVCTQLLQQWQGPIFYLGRRLPWHNDSNTQLHVPVIGPTAGHTAASVALNLGFSTVLMTGEVPESIAEMVNVDQPRIFNLDSEAASCLSIPFVSINDVELTHLRPDFANHMETTVRTVSLPELDELAEELVHASEKLRMIRSLCSQARTCFSHLQSIEPDLDSTKITDKLNGIQTQLQKDFSLFLAAIFRNNGFESSYSASVTRCKYPNSADLVSWTQNDCNFIEEGAASLISLIRKLEQRIDIRRQEHDSIPDIRQLAKRWRQDETPGRILLWKRANWQRVRPEDRAWVQRTIGKFRSTLRVSDTALEKDSNREYGNTDKKSGANAIVDRDVTSTYGKKVSSALNAIMGGSPGNS